MSRALEKGDRGQIYCDHIDGKVIARQYIRDHLGVRRRMRGTGKSEAAARRALNRNVEQAFLDSQRKARGATVEQAAREWLETIVVRTREGNLSPSTQDTYTYHLESNLLPRVEGVYLDELTTGRIYQLLEVVAKENGRSSAKTCRTILSGICGLMARQDRMERNPVRDLGRSERRVRKTPRALNAGEVVELLKALDDSTFARRRDLPDLIRFMLATGVRIGEALAVAWEDVDLEAGTVSVWHTIIRVKGKGLVRRQTKTEASDRTLALPAWCVELLRARAARAVWEPVFPSSRGTWQDKNNVGASIRKVREGTPVDWFVSHTARRTVATMLDEQGLSARAIADQLGHANPSMTQDVYMGRKVASPAAAQHLDAALGSIARRER